MYEGLGGGSGGGFGEAHEMTRVEQPSAPTQPKIEIAGKHTSNSDIVSRAGELQRADQAQTGSFQLVGLEDVPNQNLLTLPEGKPGSSRPVLRSGETAESRVELEEALTKSLLDKQKNLDEIDPDGAIRGKPVDEAINDLVQSTPPEKVEEEKTKLRQFFDDVVSMVPGLNEGASVDDLLSALLIYSHNGGFRSLGEVMRYSKELNPVGAITDAQLWHHSLVIGDESSDSLKSFKKQAGYDNAGDPTLMVKAIEKMYQEGLQQSIARADLDKAKTDKKAFQDLVKKVYDEVIKPASDGNTEKWIKAQEGLSVFYTGSPTDKSKKFAGSVMEMFHHLQYADSFKQYYPDQVFGQSSVDNVVPFPQQQASAQSNQSAAA